MRKDEYIDLLIKDNRTSGDRQKLYADVIDCTDIALSQMPSDFEVDSAIGLKELFADIEKAGRASPNRCVGPFEAAEIIAKKLGATYVRASMRKEQTGNDIVRLEDLL